MKTALLRVSYTRVAVVLLTLSLTAAAVPSGKPEDVGLSSERLQRINELVQRSIEPGQISGAVTMVSRKGRVAHFEAQGLMDIDAQTPMRKDAIFRMASMSKPVTGVAILMLMEEWKLRIGDPVSQFIPEFKNIKVAMAKPLPPGSLAGGQPPRDPEIFTVPADREITIRDLMTHTSGLESGWDGAFGTHFWVDRKEQLVGLLMIQEPVAAMGRDFENAVMQAIVE